ncbi:hypothetical protein SERLA73DRAFT_142956 [Serpula lacrymans var. lacrymans S7.3]|uniref:Uncharacterized protein n=2 Tax=Serpula lacrymans var. lacrymans TaxID=341189 RepID=F8Q8P1_SERL3|nr:uncharacterized protein SERLADRAFT_399272 [Serpula lacrymans var. lacrymans S7.9]EGN94946.1 hypothetical protein SERLA73DRAFT_142956 [Serpula lacrymans var. lacrymans S7.3]EGO20439.1 hypothetical protein SERLADRAFT_399272 [Serpula lacrymans var. lacrymans S7.9]
MSDRSSSKSTGSGPKPLTSTEDPLNNSTAKGVFAHLQPYARSKGPALTLSTLFALSAAVPHTVLRPSVYFPQYVQRVGFSLVFGGAAYVLATGDSRNGSGIVTAWSLTYLFLHLRRSIKPPHHPLTLAMTGGATVCAGLYGTEYFMYQT